jgi:hyperosmotically inducible protein
MKKTFLLGTFVLLVIAGSLYGATLDSRIEASAMKTYVFKTYLKGDDIHVNSKDGVVTLTGTVEYEFHKSLAADTVEDLPGVKSVDNRLTVKGAVPAKDSDAWILMNVKTMLLFHRNVSATGTEVIVKDGKVTLRGEAGSEAERQLAAEYANDVEGVKDVANEMTVAKTAKTEHRTMGEFIDDSSIYSQIKMALTFHKGASPFKAHIHVIKGVVTVTGDASSAAQKDLVTKRIEDIHGVVKIHNQMVIK